MLTVYLTYQRFNQVIQYQVIQLYFKVLYFKETPAGLSQVS